MKKLANLLSTFSLVWFGFLLLQPAFSQDGLPNGTCSFQTLNLPGNAAGFDTAEAINDIGAIVGTATADEQVLHGYLFFAGKFSMFMFPGAQRTAAHDINNHAQIVGEYADKAGSLHGFLVVSGGFQTIDDPAGVDTVATGINDLGDIVGFFRKKTDLGFAISFLLHKGKFTSFSFPGADPGTTVARGINNSGVIVGSYSIATHGHGFMVEDGQFSSIDFPGADATQAVKVNNERDIVGTYSLTSGESNGFSFDKGVFKTISQPNTSFNAVFGVNNHDQVVGANQMPFKANCQNVF
jgi:hypothetical protein